MTWNPLGALRRHLGLSRDRATPGADVPRDALTGLVLREHFEQALEEASHRCDHEGLELAVVYLGLDHFRLINDAYGHGVGDRLLSEVPARLRAAVPQALSSTRQAGDEFALAVCGARSTVLAVAERLREALRQPFHLGVHDIVVEASVGIASYPRDGAAARLTTHAAAAMRSVKRSGGNGHAEFEPSMGEDSRLRAELLRDLRQAVARGALQLVYQPKVDAATLEVTAAEALLRWHDSRRGVVSPALFIPIAEKHGLIGDIGRWVIEEATRQAGAWRLQGLRMRVAVNVSGYQLRQDDLVEHLCGCLQRHAVSPERFTVEITESVAMENTRVTREAFDRLRQAGVHVSIDDFGTGHSSLASLRRLPAAELKIDRSFVSDLADSADARSIVATVVTIAHQLGLRVVAEGVETEAQRDWLVKLGCDELQGFLFARPMSATALGLWAMDVETGPTGVGFRDSLFRETQPSPIGLS